MFSSCLDIKFPDPINLKFKTTNECEINGEKPGLYHVILSSPCSDFIKNYHCFKIYSHSKNIPFKLEEQQIELIITSDELEYYKRHFAKVVIISSITSEKTLKHPRRNYAKKKHNERNGTHLSDIDKSVNKINLVAIHSATNPKSTATYNFDDIKSLTKFLEQKFLIKIHNKCTFKEVTAYIHSLPRFYLYIKNNRLIAQI